MSAGALIRFKPLFAGEDAAAQVLRIPFDGKWPNLKPFRLRLYEDPQGKTEVVFDAERRVVHVFLPKAETGEIVISTYIQPKELPRLGMWRWMVEGIAAPAIKQANLPKTETLRVFKQLHEVEKMPELMNRVKLSQAKVRQVTQLRQHAERGRHWMLTPHRRIALVHAVQQPLTISETKLRSTAAASLRNR